MTSEKQLTVLMPVYNTRKEWLDEAVKSILDQTYKNFSFLIIDDGSIKETADYLDTLATKDKRITVLHNEANQGLVYTLNRGLAFATTPWIARMDADDWAFPDRLSKQMEYLNKHSGITVLGTDAIYLETGRPTRKIQPFISYANRSVLAFLRLLCSSKCDSSQRRYFKNWRVSQLPLCGGLCTLDQNFI